MAWLKFRPRITNHQSRITDPLAAPAATGPARAPRQGGFTLIEIIVVVMLIAISATFVVVNLERDRDALAKLECERFARLIEQARDESLISGRPFAVVVYPDAHYYEFLRYEAATGDQPGQEEDEDEEGAWAPAGEGGSIFRRRDIPEDLNVIFELLEGAGDTNRLLIEGLGEITPFNFMIEGDDRVYAVRLDDGRNVAVSDVTPD